MAARSLEYLRRTLDPGDPAYHPFIGAWGLSDLVEAAAHTGQKDTAQGYLEQVEALVGATSGPLLLAEAGYARPMVADDDQAEALYQAALEHDLATWPCYRGRMLLWYGRWLRRQRRVAESRAPLRAARDAFDTLAFPGLAEDARRELSASGETSRRRTPGALDQLTPQELQIAQMAADGMSNREIGQQLYISHRTVGYHLHRIFPKLGITSRSQLHAAVLSLAETSA
jgi:DNA-binding CsgD family transcriptional regulator